MGFSTFLVSVTMSLDSGRGNDDGGGGFEQEFLQEEQVAGDGEAAARIFYGVVALVSGFIGFLGCKFSANVMLATVDVAVNSHLQIYLANEND